MDIIRDEKIISAEAKSGVLLLRGIRTRANLQSFVGSNLKSKYGRVLIVLGLFLWWSGCAFGPAGGPERRIALSELQDKVKGGWAGQMIGVSYGAPTEFRYLAQIIPVEKIPVWSPDRVENSLHQDDLYVEMTFARVLDNRGLDATTEDFGLAFRDSKYRLYHANLAARRNLRRGVPPSQSGLPEHNAHANDIDFQIEADFIGLMSPGLPKSSNDLCLRVGKLMNVGDGILGGVFVAGMYAAAFFESDPRRIVEAAHRSLPSESPYARLIQDVLDWSAESPEDWTITWERLQSKWDGRDACPVGALEPFNIDAKLNGGYVALGLLYGQGDFERTLTIATRAGQDSDCNPSSALGVLGTMLGYERIPDVWKEGIPAIAHQNFDFTDYSFETIVESTIRRALMQVEKTGGRRAGENVLIKVQDPEPVEIKIWDDYGSPVERISTSDSRWTWKGDWNSEKDFFGAQVRTANSAGAEARTSFRGTGAILVGPYLPNGGRADVYLDGVLSRTVDVYSGEDRPKRSEAVWHSFGLAAGEHSLRIVVEGEPYPESSGSEISLHDLIVFQ